MLVYIPKIRVNLKERPYQHDSTPSCLLSEVKHGRAWLVLHWGTTLESQVLFSFLFLSLYFYFILFYLGMKALFYFSSSSSYSSSSLLSYSLHTV
jgi:hypothetical protein